MREPQPLHHATSAINVESMPCGWSARGLFLRKADGSVEIFTPLVDYMMAFPSRSRTWQDTISRGLGLFWDFCQTRGQAIADDALERNLNVQRRLYRAFAISLLSGTIEAGDDPDGLFWPRTPVTRAKMLAHAIERFSDWAHAEGLDNPLRTLPVRCVPSDALSFSEHLVWARRRQVSMLSHLTPTNVRRTTPRLIDLGRTTEGQSAEEVKFFPPDQLEPLLWIGHQRPGKLHTTDPYLRYNIRDQMMVLLDAYGGFRRSEGLHLWVQDVVEEPEKPGHALIVINHPAEARIRYSDPLSGSEYSLSRAEILERRYGLRPRNEVLRDRYHAGWKGMDLNKDNQAFVYWLDDNASTLFWILFLGYLRFIRDPIMERRRSLGGRDHPFLFVTERTPQASGAMIGDPYSPKGYERNHAAAVRRIGLEHSKARGTTTHGLRHLYGQTLSNLGVPPSVIKKGLHHRHYLSHVPYVVPTKAQINAQLEAARRRMLGEVVQIPPIGHESSAALLALSEFITSGGARV